MPDLLLFPDEAAKQAAQAEREEQDRFRHGLVVLEAKRWERPLDRGETRERLAEGAPSTQMLRYLSRADVVSNGTIRWGILTNGRLWRLYWQGARSRAEEFLELDVAQLAGATGIQLDLAGAEADRRQHFLRVFYLLFHRDAFLPRTDDPERRTFHQAALEESRRWEEKVSTDLGRVVFDTVFPELLQSFLRHDPQAAAPPSREYLDELRRGALTFLSIPTRMLTLTCESPRALESLRGQAASAPTDDTAVARLKAGRQRLHPENPSIHDGFSWFHSSVLLRLHACGEASASLLVR